MPARSTWSRASATTASSSTTSSTCAADATTSIPLFSARVSDRSMGKITISTLDRMKEAGEKFVCITAYDATFARLVNEAGAETILVGDSLGMVLQGHDSTIPVTVDDMAYHTACVARAGGDALVIADLPFMSYDRLENALDSATALMQAGAQMVKLEGGVWL